MGIDRETVRQIGHMLRPIANRVANSIARAVVQLVDDGKKLQLMQLGALAGETIDGAEHHQPYGFSSVPLPGAEAVVTFPNGDRSHPLVVAVSDRRHRPTGGAAGEVVLYTDEGDTVRLGRGHVIALATTGEVRLGSDSASGPVVVEAALDDFMTALDGAITASGSVPAPPGPIIVATLQALQTALLALNASAGWTARTTKAKAE